MAWIKDPEMGEAFWKVCASIGVKEKFKQIGKLKDKVNTKMKENGWSKVIGMA